MHIALYQPDIAVNTGTIARLAACLSTPCHIIEPAGFDPSDRAFRRAGLDYLDHADIVRHSSYAAFSHWRRNEARRLVLLTTQGDTRHIDFVFQASDVLMLGRETEGVPQAVHEEADARLRIPMRPNLRSLNVAVATAIVLGEALRQTQDFPS